jgi:NADH-quinone oxidoreductase subunit A
MTAAPSYGVFGLYVAEIAIVLIAALVLSYVLGVRHRDKRTDVPFESGILPVGEAHIRLSAKFYLVAMFFVIFDLEAVYVFAWSVAARKVGWPGSIEIMIFLFVLAAALAYLWRVGALDWGTTRRGSRAARRRRTAALTRAGETRDANDALVADQS